MAELKNKQNTEYSLKHEDLLREAIDRKNQELYRHIPVVAIMDGVEELSEERLDELDRALVKANYRAMKKSREKKQQELNKDYEV